MHVYNNLHLPFLRYRQIDIFLYVHNGHLNCNAIANRSIGTLYWYNLIQFKTDYICTLTLFHECDYITQEYVLAICHPREKQEIISKTHLEDGTVEDIEKNTLAFVRYINGNKYEITGTDLAVTLAMSSLEDLLRKQDVEEDSAAMETDQEQVGYHGNRPGAGRLPWKQTRSR